MFSVSHKIRPYYFLLIANLQDYVQTETLNKYIVVDRRLKKATVLFVRFSLVTYLFCFLEKPGVGEKGEAVRMTLAVKNFCQCPLDDNQMCPNKHCYLGS